MEKLLGKFGRMNLRKYFHGIFDNKIVFVTGHTGFIGSWLSLWLNLLGAKVVGYSLEPPTNPSLFETIHLKKSLIDIRGNILDFDHLYSSMVKHKPDFVFHLAAQPLVLESYKNPVETISTNVIGTLNMLEAVRRISDVRICINFTSDKCYENKEIDYAYKETDSIGGFDPYSASKGASELITSSYRNSFFSTGVISQYKIGISSIRAGNVIGGGDWAPNRIVPDCIRFLTAKKNIQIRNPIAMRPWQHVLEPVSGLLWLATKMWEDPSNYAGPWNFGPNGNSITVKDLVTQILDDWGEGTCDNLSKQNKSTFHEANLLKLDCTKANTLLGWHPLYTTKEAITETISWYRSYEKTKNEMQEFTVKQIESYSERAKNRNMVWTS